MESVRSSVRQTFQDFEVLVIDDGSTDGTEESVKDLLHGEWQGKVLYHKKVNGGASSAKNFGLKLARGQYIQFLDSDDLLRPEKLAKQVTAIRSASGTIDCCLCYGRMGNQNIGWNQAMRIGEKRNTSAEYVQHLCSRKLHVVCTNAPLWRRSFLLQADGWREDLLVSEEWEYHTRLMARGPQIVFVAEDLFFVRGHEGDQLSKRYGQLRYMVSYYQAVRSVAQMLMHTPHWTRQARAGLLLRARTAYINLLRHGDTHLIREFEDWFLNLARSVPDWRMVAAVHFRRLFGSGCFLWLFALRSRLH